MKRVPPTNLPGRLGHFLSSHKYWVIVALLASLIGLTIYTLVVYVAAVTPHFGTHEYLVAAHDVAPGAKIEDADLEQVSYVDGYTPKNAIVADEKESVVGKYALVPFAAGDVLTPFTFGRTPGGGVGGLSSRLAPGMALYYLTKNDIHAAPPGVSLHDSLDIYSASEATSGAALAGLEVVDLGDGADSGEFYLGLSMSPADVQTLTQLLAKKAFLQVVVLPKARNENGRLVK